MPGKITVYLPANGAGLVLALKTARASKVLPGIAVFDFSLSPDGKRVVYDSRDENGKHRLWLASLDLAPPTMSPLRVMPPAQPVTRRGLRRPVAPPCLLTGPEPA